MDSMKNGSGMEGQSAVFDPERQGWQAISDDGFIGLVGPIWQKLDESSMRLAFLAEAKHRNRRGVVHGGMIMAFADRALGMTARRANGQKPQATIQLDVHFVDAVQMGEFVEIQAEIVRQTRSLIFMKADIVVGSRVVATANGIWKTLAGE
jgi:uncharacterized protein (TIGR00369 family)